MAYVDTTEATISKTDDQPCHVTAPIASVRTAKPRKMTRRKDSPLCSVAADVAVRPALRRLSAAAVCAPSSRLLHAQMIPARLDWTRSDLSQVRTSALTLSTSALKPVAWISRSVGMDEGRATKGAMANDVRPVGEGSIRRTSIYGQRRPRDCEKWPIRPMQSRVSVCVCDEAFPAASTQAEYRERERQSGSRQPASR